MTEGGAPPADGVLPALLKLQTWMSPAFPIGAFGHSHGLEAAVAGGLVRDAAECFDWISTLLRRGSGWNDLVLMTAAYRAARTDDDAGLVELAELGTAMSGSAERRRETADLGAAFATAAGPWGEGLGTGMPYPIAVGTLAARQDIPLAMGLAAYAHAFAANLVSAAVRLVPLGQSEAVGILHRLESILSDVTERALRSTLDDLGSAAILSEIQAMRHETLTTRLFRT